MKQKILFVLGSLLLASGAWATDYTLTLYADGCGSPNTFICLEGQQLSVNATPMAHRHFVQWNDGNTDNPRLVTMNQNYTYTATFAPDSFNISLSASPTSYGSVSGAGRYQYNSTAILSATANYGYKFSKWNDGNTTNPRSITVECDSSFVAEFAPNQYQCDATCDNTRGSVSVNGEDLLNADFVVKLMDSYGDGWNGNKLTITDGTHSYDCTMSFPKISRQFLIVFS